MASTLRPARLLALRSASASVNAMGQCWRPVIGGLSAANAGRSPLMQTPVRHKSGPYGYTQAKALVFSKFGEPSDVLSLHTHSITPSLPPHAALVRTLAAPINPADINMVQGTYGSKPAFESLIGTAEPSAVGGNEGCFEVVSVGSEVKNLKPGDWALPSLPGLGTWRTHILVDNADSALIDIPQADTKGLSPSGAATATVNPCTAWRMLRGFVDLVDLSVKSGTGAGAWFIQNGGNSGVGRAAIQLGRLWGLRSINVVRARPTEEETAALKKELTDLGATVVLTEDELAERGFAKKLRAEYMGGESEKQSPLLLGFNCVGGRAALNLTKCLSQGGKLITYGAMSKQPLSLPAGMLIFRDLSFHGFWVSRWAKTDPKARRQAVEAVLGLMREGKFVMGPEQEIPWTWETGASTLQAAAGGTLDGFRSGKSIFVFKDT